MPGSAPEFCNLCLGAKLFGTRWGCYLRPTSGGILESHVSDGVYVFMQEHLVLQLEEVHVYRLSICRIELKADAIKLRCFAPYSGPDRREDLF